MINSIQDVKSIIDIQNEEVQKNEDILQSIKNFSTEESKISFNIYEKKISNDYSLDHVYILYNNYMNALENPEGNPLLIKNSFDCYINLIYNTYVRKIDGKTCRKIQKLRNPNQNFDFVKFDPLHKSIFNKKNYPPEFYHFFKILEYVWKHKDIKQNNILLLSPCKVFILRSLILRKFEIQLDLKNSTKIKKQINQLKFINSKKRDEENLKFLLKKFFKFLQSYKYKNSQNSFEEIFNDFFKNQITREFYNKVFILKNNSNRKMISIKKINNSIMKELLKSRSFLNILKLYCNEYLLKEFNLEISWKLFMLIKKWKKFMKPDDADVLNGICYSIENDKKFKLPWTINEIEESVKQIFDNLEDN